MHYVIIGNGVAGITAAFTLRERDRHARITVISGESDYFISRTALMYAYMDRMNLRDLEPFERKAYDKQKIDRVRGWVRDLNADQRQIRLEDGRKIIYDRLLLAVGSAPNRFQWPGLNAAKDGVVHFVSLQHLAECEGLTPSTKRAVVVGGGLIGVELVECLVHHGVEVDFLVRESWYWPMALAKEEGELIANHIRRHGVKLHIEHEVNAVRADASGRVVSVSTNKGLDLPCQMLGICIGVRPAVDWLKPVTTPPEINRGIKVNQSFQTTLPDVFSAGDCAEFVRPDGSPLVEQIWYAAKRQGELAARAMLGDAVDYKPSLFYNSAKFFDIEYTTVGDVTRLPDDATSFLHRLPGDAVSIRVIERNGSVIGFNMLGSRWDHTWFERWIHERRSMEDVMQQLHLAQFDVEFGRVRLDGVRAAFAEYLKTGSRRAA
ncbi:MAG: NAD(P)/FAD-dependent oxidoreductase [Acidobacteria bacterium]|nr:NAD(P)/FAD-dependent oxidoreductase [Acidobacteriota bacterium]